MDNKKLTIDFIKSQFGEFKNIIGDGRKDPCEKLTEHGFIEERNGGHTYGVYHYMKNGIHFTICFYNSNYTYSADYSVSVGAENYLDCPVRFHMVDINNKIDNICKVYSIPGGVNYNGMGEDSKSLLNKVLTIISTARENINIARTYGALGSYLRGKGYFVHYNGDSICNFTKDGIVFHAYNDYPKGWVLQDVFEFIDEDGVVSSSFSTNDKNHLCLENDFEAIFGGLKNIGKYETEREKFFSGKIKFKEFRVRSYSNKYLSTISYFDKFEDAKKFAYDEAKRRAESITNDLRRYARTNPMDIGADEDYLACYVYYQYGSAKQVIFVQGEGKY